MRVLVNPFDEAEKLASERGNWVVGVLETRIFWPTKKQTLHYDGKLFILLPVEKHEGQLSSGTQPAIAINACAYNLSPELARKELMRFASALSWREGQKVEIVGWSGGILPKSYGIIRNSGIRDYLDEDYLPSPSSEYGRTALAFYREGISLDNPFYSFLSLYKAFTVAIPNGRDRDGWMTANRNKLKNEASDRAGEIEESGSEVGAYLYEKCRHAIAHADREPYVNPDSTDDHFRVSKDIPLMRNFAELAIEEKFGIMKPSGIYSEHLFELEGFRKILPMDLLDRLKKGQELEGTQEIELPDHYLLLAKRGHMTYPLPLMRIIGGGHVKGGLILDFGSDVGVIRARVMLNFAEEKLRFDPIGGFAINQNRSERLMAEEELAALKFSEGMLSNGRLEIWDPNLGDRLGCSECYIPLNCLVNHEHFAKEIKIIEEIIIAGK